MTVNPTFWTRLLRRLIVSGLILGVLLLIINWPLFKDDSTSATEVEIDQASGPGSEAETETIAVSETQTDAEPDRFNDIELNQPWTGDFDGMVERGVVRMLVVYNKIMFFFDRGRQLGTTPFLAAELEKLINEKLKRKTQKIKVILIPVRRDQLLPGLIEGRGDIAVANLTITPERQKLIDFAEPVVSDVKETLVTGPAAPKIDSIDDLSGKILKVRESSSYYASLLALNQRFESESRAPVKIEFAPEDFEDSDLLEMVNTGLLEMAIVDSHKAEFWITVFDDLTHRPDIYIREGGEIAAAFRKNSPKLEKIYNELVDKTRKGTLLGNIAIKRYLKENKWARNALSEKELKKLESVIGLFQKYADQYEFDHLMTIALAYQESQLDQSKRSGAGAIGIMQLLESTASDPNIDINGIDKLETNIHAGTKYLHFVHDRYFNDPAIDPLNQMLFSFAAYNAGPARITKLRTEAASNGFDPNLWFNNVEVIAARRIGRETVQYVANIYKYYIAYSSIRARKGAFK